jgi:probable HAF family extracellular repeat protein
LNLCGGKRPVVNRRLINATREGRDKNAYGINDAGQIVGVGMNPSGQGHAFLLNPLPPCQLTYTGFHQGGDPGVPSTFGPGHISTASAGCVLCSAASMLTSFGVAITPATLDALLLRENAYTTANELFLTQLPDYVSSLVQIHTTDNDPGSLSCNDFLTQRFCNNGERVILQLQVKEDGAWIDPYHYVLVTGRIGAGSDWNIFDPGWKNAVPSANATTLSGHLSGFSANGHQWQFAVAGYRAFQVGSQSHFVAVANCPLRNASCGSYRKAYWMRSGSRNKLF